MSTHLPRRVFRAGMALLLLLSLAMLAGTSQADEGDGEGPYPGLPPTYIPPPPQIHTAWGGAATTSATDVQGAKQWIRQPLQVMAFDMSVGALDPLPGFTFCSGVAARAYFVAPEGSAHNYGESADIPIRTVAFGTIPVEATVRLEQGRDARDLPTPIIEQTKICGFPITVPDLHLSVPLSTRVTSLKVDGVEIDLADTCRSAPGELRVIGRGYTQPSPPQPFWESGVFNVSPGGLLSGTIDVPMFTGCVTSNGDDLSPLISAVASGNDNPISIFQGSAFACSRKVDGVDVPPAPGASSPEDVPCSTDGYNLPPIPDLPDDLG